MLWYVAGTPLGWVMQTIHNHTFHNGITFRRFIDTDPLEPLIIDSYKENIGKYTKTKRAILTVLQIFSNNKNELLHTYKYHSYFEDINPIDNQD